MHILTEVTLMFYATPLAHVEKTCRPVNLRSNTVKATDFKCDVQSRQNLLTFFEKGPWSRLRDPLNLWILNANRCKPVKATGFKFSAPVPRDCAYITR